MYDLDQPSATTSTSALYCHSIDDSKYISIQDKGKGREEGPIPFNQARSSHGKARASSISLSRASIVSQSRQDQRNNLSLYSPFCSSPAESDCAPTPTETSPFNTITSLTSTSSTFCAPLSLEPTAVVNGCDCRGASMSGCCAKDDHSTCTPVNNLQDDAHTAAEKQMSRFGLRRRPFRSGIAPIVSQSSSEEIMSEMDRSSIFSDLNLDFSSDLPATRLTTLPHTVDLMTSSSIKRSFEEANTPSRSPRSEGRNNSQDDQARNGSSSRSQSSRAFTSSVSHPVVPLQESDHIETSSRYPEIQSTRRRIPHKRRRAASLETSSDMDAYLVSFNSRNDESDYPMSANEKQRVGSTSTTSHAIGNLADSSSIVSGASTSERGRMRRDVRHEIAQQAIDDFQFESGAGTNTREDAAMENNVDSFSGTMNLLRRWWVDTEDSLEVQSPNRRDAVFGGSNSQSYSNSNSNSNQCDAVGVSSAVSPASHDPSITRSVLRHLQLQERVESDDINVEQAESHSNGMRYHDELMDVFRRLSESSNNGADSGRPSMPPRSSTMSRSTTQISDNPRSTLNIGTSNRLVHQETSNPFPANGHSEESREQLSSRTSTMLPSARTYQTQLSRINQERQANLRSQFENYQEVARRNQEVLRQYADNTSSQRLRHSGSPTFPEGANRDVDRSGRWNDNRFSNDDNDQRRDSTRQMSSTTHISQRTSSPDIITSHFQSDERTSSRLWGEYLESRLARQDTSTGNVDSIGGLSDETFDFLFPTFGHSSSRSGAPTTPLPFAGVRRRAHGTSLSRFDESRPELNEYRSRTSRLEDEAMVMSTYRQMSFPDPEATLGFSSSGQAPQLPSLPSSSPLISPLDDGLMDWSRRDTSRPRDSLAHAPIRPDSYRDLHSSRPSLRPLRLTSRLADQITAATFDSPTTATRSATEETFGQMTTSHRRRPFSSVDDQRRDVLGPRQLHLNHSREEPRSRLGRTSPHRRDGDVRHRHRLERTASSFSSQLPRRLTSRDDNHRHMRPREGALSSVERRRNNLGGTFDSNDTGRSESRNDYSLVPNSPSELNQAGVIGSRTTAAEALARSSRPYLPFTRFGPRLTSRYDRYLEEIGSAIGARSLTQQQHRNHEVEGAGESSSTSLASMLTSSSSTSAATPSWFNLSRLPSGSASATSLRSEIALNPANYVADDDFALRDTYEGLLQLSAQIGEVRCRATPAHVIDKLPTCLYDDWMGGNCSKTVKQEQNQDDSIGRTSKGKAKAKEDYHHLLEQRSNRDTTCSICLETYQASESIMSLPCDHTFHQDCVTTWLKTARSCPCCRGNVCSEEALEKTSSSLMQSSFASMPWHRLLPELNF